MADPEAGLAREQTGSANYAKSQDAGRRCLNQRLFDVPNWDPSDFTASGLAVRVVALESQYCAVFLPRGVIGSTTDSGSVSWGSSPCGVILPSCDL